MLLGALATAAKPAKFFFKGVVKANHKESPKVALDDKTRWVEKNYNMRVNMSKKG